MPKVNFVNINKKHKEVAGFLRNLIKLGHKEAWDIWRDELESKGLYDVYDFNDIYDLSQWITGSVTNSNDIDKEPHQYVMDTLDSLL